METEISFLGIRFGNLFWGTGVLFFLAVFLIVIVYRFKNRSLSLLIHPVHQDKLVRDYASSQKKTFTLFSFLGIFFLCFALLEPKWGFEWHEMQRKGVDIMIGVDVSRSMMAKDLVPDRLTRAKRKILDLLELIEGDRIGLIAFAGVSYLQCPLTLDYSAFRMFLDLLDTNLIPQQGTAIDAVIDEAISAFSASGPKSRALILITDGEEHSGAWLEAAQRAKDAGIRIYTIGMGSPEGHPVPDPSGNGQLKDKDGSIVISRLNEEILQELALKTSGAYTRAMSVDEDLRRIYEGEIQKELQKQDLKSLRQKRYEHRFQWFLLLSFLFLFMEVLVKIRPQRLTVLIFFLFSFQFSWSLDLKREFGFASREENQILSGVNAYKGEDFETALREFGSYEIENPNDFSNFFNMGNVLYKKKDYDGASVYFAKASASESLYEDSVYNLGNSLYRAGKLQEAISSWEQVLKKNKGHEKARKNLEIARKKLRDLMNQSQNKNQDQNQAQNQNQQSNQKEQDKSSQNQQSQNSQDQSAKGEEKKDPQNSKQQSGDEKKQGDQKKDLQDTKSQQQSPKQTQTAVKSEENKHLQKSEEKKDGKEEGKKDRKEKEAEEKNDAGGLGGQTTSTPERMSKDQAQRFLNRLSKENQDQIRKFIQYRLSDKQSRGGEKEW